MLAVRDGDWKLLPNPDRSRVALYDVVKDPGESDDLAQENKGIVERLAAMVLAWQSLLPPGKVDPRAGQNSFPWPGSTKSPANP